jgi:hypothetical protein
MLINPCWRRQVKGAGDVVLKAASIPGTRGEHVFVQIKEAGAYTLEVTPYFANIPVIYLARVSAICCALQLKYLETGGLRNCVTSKKTAAHLHLADYLLVACY